MMPFNFLFLENILDSHGGIDGLRSSGDDGRVLWAGGRGLQVLGGGGWVLKEDLRALEQSPLSYLISLHTFEMSLSLNASNSLTKTGTVQN